MLLRERVSWSLRGAWRGRTSRTRCGQEQNRARKNAGGSPARISRDRGARGARGWGRRTSPWADQRPGRCVLQKGARAGLAWADDAHRGADMTSGRTGTCRREERRGCETAKGHPRSEARNDQSEREEGTENSGEGDAGVGRGCPRGKGRRSERAGAGQTLIVHGDVSRFPYMYVRRGSRSRPRNFRNGHV